MNTGDYILSKRFLSFLGNYKLTDADGRLVIRFVGHFRFALRFDAIDAQGHVLYRGQGKLFDARNVVTFTRNGQPYGSMHAEWEGGLRRYIVSGGLGDALQTHGDCATAWSLMRHNAEVVRVERRSRRWNIKLMDSTHSEFALTVAMAIVYQTLGDERPVD
jgi:hypothetical protein